jgi:hypothetical protein
MKQPCENQKHDWPPPGARLPSLQPARASPQLQLTAGALPPANAGSERSSSAFRDAGCTNEPCPETNGTVPVAMAASSSLQPHLPIVAALHCMAWAASASTVA